MHRQGIQEQTPRSPMRWLLYLGRSRPTAGFASVVSAEDDVSCGDQPAAPTLPEEANRTYTLSAARDISSSIRSRTSYALTA